MAARLRLVLMFHIEDATRWNASTGTAYADMNALRIASLSYVVGDGGTGRGARLSVQVGRWWLDCEDEHPDGDEPYSPPTSLSMVLDYGGNFWCHTHDASADFLQSVHMCVASAWAAESEGTIEEDTFHTAGRSGGGDLDQPDLDWISISVARGVRRMNSTSIGMNASLPESMRPHGITLQDMDPSGGVYFHDVAPGPLVDGPITLNYCTRGCSPRARILRGHELLDRGVARGGERAGELSAPRSQYVSV